MSSNNNSKNNNNNGNRTNNGKNNGNNRFRGNNNGNNSRYKNNRKTKNNKEKFKGKYKELEGIIFDANRYIQADEYIKSVNEIAEYIGANYDNGADVRRCIEEGVKIDIEEPEEPLTNESGNISETKKMIWMKEIDYYVKRHAQLDSNLRKACSLVWGQCTDVMREKLESLTTFNTIKANYDVLELLNQMKIITFKFEDQKYPFSSVYFANKKFYNYK